MEKTNLIQDAEKKIFFNDLKIKKSEIKSPKEVQENIGDKEDKEIESRRKMEKT